jgi:EmrB/QacA subfamily drug resistance transporter
VTIGLVCGPFISMVDSNAVNVAVSEIAREMDASLALVGWTISAYLLGIAAALPATAWLARRYGVRRVYAVALAAFALASIACAAAPTVEALIALRAVQGVTSAPLIPLALSLIYGGGSKLRPPLAAGMFFFLAPALGPTFGGLISATVGWRPIFLVNVPLVALGLLGVRRVPDPQERSSAAPARLDLVGLILLAAGATVAIYGASIITARGSSVGTGWIICLVGIAMLGAYAGYGRWRQRRGASVAVSLHLLADAGSRIAVVVCAVASVVLFAVFFLVPVFLIQGQGHSPLVAGLALFPQGIAMGLCSGLGEKLVDRFGLRATVMAGMVILAATTALLLEVSLDTPPWLIAVLMTGRGAALGFTLQPLITGLMTRFKPEEVTDVSTLFNVGQRVAGSLGIAGVAAFYQAEAAVGELVVAFRATVTLLIALGAIGLLLAVLLPGRGRPGWHAPPDSDTAAGRAVPAEATVPKREQEAAPA